METRRIEFKYNDHLYIGHFVNYKNESKRFSQIDSAIEDIAKKVLIDNPELLLDKSIAEVKKELLSVLSNESIEEFNLINLPCSKDKIKFYQFRNLVRFINDQVVLGE